MDQITHDAVMDHFSGKQIDRSAFERIASKNETGCAVYNSTWMSDPVLCSLFGLTPRLCDLWLSSGTEFNLYLELEGETITRCILDKFRTSETARPVTTVLKPTQQELRIARRILDHITK